VVSLVPFGPTIDQEGRSEGAKRCKNIKWGIVALAPAMRQEDKSEDAEKCKDRSRGHSCSSP